MSSTNLLTMPMQSLQQSISQTVALWAKFPLQIQADLAERLALEDLGECVKLVQSKKKPDEWEPVLKKFLKHFKWVQRTEYPSSSEVMQFRASDASFSCTVDNLLVTAGENRDDELLSGFDIEDPADQGEASGVKAPVSAAIEKLKQGAQAGAQPFVFPICLMLTCFMSLISMLSGALLGDECSSVAHHPGS